MDSLASKPAARAKYGKNNRKVLSHNFFDWDENSARVDPSSRFPISPTSEGSDTSTRQEPIVAPTPPSCSVRPAHVTSHSRFSISLNDELRSASPSNQQHPAASSDAEQSMFDLHSSDDEHATRQKIPMKRRKLTQTTQKVEPVAMHTVTKLIEQGGRPPLAKKPENAKSALKKSSSKQVQPVAGVQSKKQSGSRDAPMAIEDSSSQNQVVSKTKLTKATYSKRNSKQSVFEPGESKAFGDTEMSEVLPEPRRVQKSKTALKARSNQPETPRKQQYLNTDSDASTASPSQLGLGNLQLTPDKSPAPAQSTENKPPISKPISLLRGSRRLVDRLDAPEEDSDEESPPPVTRKLSKARAGSSNKELFNSQLEPASTQSASSQGRYGKARNTYAKERSHLRDVGDDLDMLSNSSQDASQQLASQLAISTQPSQLQMELDMSDSLSEDVEAGTRLKSIHELRQAGTNNRYERELETLLEDVDPSSTLADKSSRLQALMKVIKKMSQDSFASLVSDRALERLVGWSPNMKDRMSKVLLDMILWRLVYSNNASIQKLRIIIGCVMSNSKSVSKLGYFSDIVRDRNERLSKLMTRELLSFEKATLAHKLLPAYEGDHIIPAAVTLGCLKDCLRSLVALGDRNISIGPATYKSIIRFLEQASQPTQDGGIQHKFITKLALSLLQLASGPLDSDLGLPDHAYEDLANALASIMTRSMQQHEDLLQAVLHFAIILCNDRPAICEHFSRSAIGNAALTVIESRFLDLVEDAEKKVPVDKAILDSIILSLACLLNITEHDATIRLSFAQSGASAKGTNRIASLVQIYIKAAPRLVGATTEQQSEVLVAFAYLSLLICNLCLHEKVWEEVSALLGDYSMSDVVASAKEFLMHLREVGKIEGEESGIASGDAASDILIQRFGQILKAVRVE